MKTVKGIRMKLFNISSLHSGFLDHVHVTYLKIKLKCFKDFCKKI
jgi:hypothetical protein